MWRSERFDVEGDEKMTPFIFNKKSSSSSNEEDVICFTLFPTRNSPVRSIIAPTYNDQIPAHIQFEHTSSTIFVFDIFSIHSKEHSFCIYVYTKIFIFDNFQREVAN